MTKRKGERVQVDSLAVAAALIASDCKLIECTPVSPRRWQFLLEGIDAELLAADYTLGRLEGNLRDFMTAFDMLRTKVRQGGA